jgi:hypothetical protein
MTKPIYKYPDFVSNVELNRTDNKRYWLKLEIDKTKNEKILIILKNPSRADKVISDKTIFNVSNYINKNRNKYDIFINVGEITIVNLMPNYLTESNQLQNLESSVIDQKNNNIIAEQCSKIENVIIAWGNHPSGLFKEYEILKDATMNTLEINNNKIFYVDSLSQSGNPKHGQVWGYKNELKKFIGNQN